MAEKNLRSRVAKKFSVRLVKQECIPVGCSLTISGGRGRGMSAQGYACPVGVPAQGQGVCPQGGVYPGECLPRWVSAQGVCFPGGVCPGGVVAVEGGVCPGGIPCDLSHHAFDVTCMLSCHQLRLMTSAAAYIVFGHVTCGACWNTTPPVDEWSRNTTH